MFNLPSSYEYRVSNFYYTDILDENDVSIGYDGMRSFCVANDVVSDDVLSYYLNQKDLYNPGLMKASYGTFLSSLLVIYEHDCVADMAGETFNVTWSRVSPVCVSLCNDFNCLYITGESDHGMGLEAVGNSSDVWKFHFATSFSFSLVEQLVGNNVWNTTKIGSVTLGLFESYLNNETLEFFYSNGYLFLKRENENNTWLFLDVDTGIVRDFFNFNGILGTMPCYHDNITDNAWAYGNNLLDNSSLANKQINVVFGACFLSSFFVEAGMSLGSFFVEAGMFLTGIVPVLGEFTLSGAGLVGVVLIPIFIVLFPDESNALWLEFAYLLNPEARDYPDIPIYEGTDLNIYRLFYNHNPVIINPEDEKLYDYYTTILAKQWIPNKETPKLHRQKLINERDRDFKIKIVAGGPKIPDHGNITERSNKIGEYIKEFKDEFMSAERINKFFVLKDNLLKITTIGIFIFSEKTIFDIIFYSIVTYFIGNDNSTNSTNGP